MGLSDVIVKEKKMFRTVIYVRIKSSIEEKKEDRKEGEVKI